jgi:hypothetical protein
LALGGVAVAKSKYRPKVPDPVALAKVAMGQVLQRAIDGQNDDGILAAAKAIIASCSKPDEQVKVDLAEWLQHANPDELAQVDDLIKQMKLLEAQVLARAGRPVAQNMWTRPASAPYVAPPVAEPTIVEPAAPSAERPVGVEIAPGVWYDNRPLTPEELAEIESGDHE